VTQEILKIMYINTTGVVWFGNLNTKNKWRRSRIVNAASKGIAVLARKPIIIFVTQQTIKLEYIILY